MEISTLNETFGIAGVFEFTRSSSGLVKANVATPACKAELYLQGAHLTHWCPTGQHPVLFVSPASNFAAGKAIRGGVPVIFPWFGSRSPMAPTERTDGPSHGFARISAWAVTFAALAGEELTLTLSLGPNDLSRSLGFPEFQAALTFTFGKQLDAVLSVVNTGTEVFCFEEALHTYLHVGDAQRVSIYGLAETRFIDKTDSMKLKVQEAEILQLLSETDRLYQDTSRPVTLVDPSLGRRITVSKHGSESTVVWNPWTTLAAKLEDMTAEGWENMVCIETANAAANRITLQPKQTHEMRARITVEEIG